jgi:hypothetical protein
MSIKVCRALCVAIVVLLLAAVAYPGPDISRFDPLLKTSWYGVYMSAESGSQGGKIGYMKTALEKIDQPINGWRMTTLLNMNIMAGTESLIMSIEDTRIYNSPNGELFQSRLLVKSPTGDIAVDGEAEGGKYILRTNMGGQVTEKSFAHPLDYLDSVLCLEIRAIAGALKAGDKFDFSLFEATPPLTGLIHQTANIVGEEEYLFNGVPTHVIIADVTIKEANITARSRIDRFGNMLEGSIGGAMTLKLEDEAIATHLDQSFDILNDNIVKVRGELKEPSKAKQLKLRISGIDTSGVLATNIQKVTAVNDSNFLLELIAQQTPSKSVPLDRLNMPNPFSPNKESTELQDAISHSLQSEPYIQSDDPKIVDLARQIAGDEKNSWAAAKKINAWVYENIEKRFTPDLSNALQTLNSRRGDCGEHTALAVALLRAAGIPARPIVGLIYWPPGDGFGYHAWVEAYVGEWVQMDPSWGEDLANPARIAIARGDIIAQVGALYKIMGKIGIEAVANRR